jgi:hypothetical protein
MKRDEREAATTIVVIAVIIGILALVHLGGHVASRLAVSVSAPAAILAAALFLATVAALAGLRRRLVARALGRRVSVQLVPSPSFDPPPEAVVRLATGLARARRSLGGALLAPACSVRIRLDPDGSGRLRYVLGLPAHAAGALRTALAAYGESVELREAPADPRPPDSPGAHVARAELVLARPSHEPLRDAGLDPDPLAAFARALAGLRARDGERAEVCIDLLPVTAAGRRRARRGLLRRVRREERRALDRPSIPDLLDPGSRGRGPALPSDSIERAGARRALEGKLGRPEPLFRPQILIRASSPEPGVAILRVEGLLAAFDAFSGENHLRAVGLRLGGLAFWGSDAPWRRRGFDRRLRTGLFAPTRRRLVTASEVAGLLKPPSARCGAPNVARTGGVVPPPPPGLPDFDGQSDLLPLGRITQEGRERLVGVPLSDTFFSYVAGRSRYGKTETGVGQFLHLVRSGHGGLFLDPHSDALEKIRPYLTEEGMRERVVEIDLADPRRQPGWNLFALSGASEERLAGRVDAVVDSFASALRWDETNTRALNLITQAAQALAELARALPPELAPTIFQIPTLLSNEEWREAALRHVSAPTRAFFAERFPRLAAEAITPVTNMVDRLRVSRPVAALLGSPTSSYDVREAMDTGKIVLACPGEGSVRDRLVANLLVYDLLHAAKSRASTPAAGRRPFYLFLDEVQTYDGASSGNLAALLEQSAKFGIRALLFNQSPERLTSQTLNAIATNRSHLATTALGSKAAAILAREFGGAVEPQTISSLQRHHFLASVTVGGEVSPPFALHGVAVPELFPEAEHPDRLDELAEAVGRNGRHRDTAEAVAALEGHDRAILVHLRGRSKKRPTKGPGGAAGARTLGGGESG